MKLGYFLGSSSWKCSWISGNLPRTERQGAQKPWHRQISVWCILHPKWVVTSSLMSKQPRTTQLDPLCRLFSVALRFENWHFSISLLPSLMTSLVSSPSTFLGMILYYRFSPENLFWYPINQIKWVYGRFDTWGVSLVTYWETSRKI